MCRRLVDAGAHVAPDPHRGRPAVRRPHHLRRPGLRAGPRVALRRRAPDPAHPPRPEPPTSCSSRRPRRGCSASTPPASATTCSPTRCSPPGRRCWWPRRCTPRCGSTRRCRTTWRTLRAPRRARGRARGRAPRRRRRRRRPPGRAGHHRRRGRGDPRRGPPAGDLAGLKVLVTAGGTREPIDPVRFISNRSLRQAGPRHRRGGRGAGRRASRSITTVDRPVSAGIEVVPRRHRRRDGRRRRSPPPAAPTSS